MTLAVIIVSYNVREFLEQALLSLQKALQHVQHEIFVVDNASSDGTVAFLQKRFSGITFFENDQNVGFARANNQAIAQTNADYICLINPDTIVQEDTFAVLLDFFEKHSDAGMVGCKVLNPDGSLQLACRRSFPTPWVALTKIVGLAKLFPKSRLFGRYNLTYLDPEQVSEVEAISGSFMLVRRSLVEHIGGLDEDFFMYGEDLDWCYRIRQTGHKIYYVPDTQIIHFKGESSKKSPFQQRRLFYEAMRLFVQKHFKKGTAVVPSWLLVTAIYASAMVSYISTALKKLLWPLIDFLLLTASLALAIFIRFQPEFPWAPFLLVHAVYSVVWLASFAAHGLYTRSHLSSSKAASAAFFGLLFNSALTFFFKQYGFSRVVVLVAGAVNIVLLPLWRIVLKTIATKGTTGFSAMVRTYLLRRRSLVVGDEKTSERLIKRLRGDVNSSYVVEGVVVLNNEFTQERILNVPIVGVLDDLPEIIKRERAQEVIFSTDKLPYDKMLSAVANSLGSQISFKMVPSQLDVVIGKATIDYIEDIPFVDLTYRLHSGSFKNIKRFFDVAFSTIALLIFSPVYAYLRFSKKPISRQSVHVSRRKQVEIKYFQNSSAWWFLPALPQVIRGHISLVGRELLKPVDPETSPTSYSIKPGLSGLEQINRHLDLSEKDRKRYHLYYLKNYSPFLDLDILMKSIFKQNN